MISARLDYLESETALGLSSALHIVVMSCETYVLLLLET